MLKASPRLTYEFTYYSCLKWLIDHPIVYNIVKLWRKLRNDVLKPNYMTPSRISNLPIISNISMKNAGFRGSHPPLIWL